MVFSRLTPSLIVAWFFFICPLVGQEDPPPDPENFEYDDCPEITYCFDGTTTLSGIAYSPELNSPEVNACFGSSWSPSNLKFIAVSSEIDMTLTWTDDRYMKISILDECYGGGACIEGADCDDSGEIQIYTDELIIGHSYILAVDNCEPGPLVSWPFEISISPGPPGVFESVSGVYLEEAASCNNGLSDALFCYGIDLQAKLIGADEDEIEHLENSGAIWNFNVSGPEAFSFSTDQLSGYNINFSSQGNYLLELESVEMECVEFPIGVEFSFEITRVDEEFGLYDVCAHDLNDWTPGAFWLGPGISEPGDYQFWFNDECGCPYYQSLSVNKIEEPIEEVILELCPDDYPYDYFGEYELNYFPDDYELMLTFDRGSLIEDWDGMECDSLVHLFVINENPEDRCSSCMLPLSLEDGKIVYCVNFDNGTYDSSGKANPIEAVGVGYDNNGPASNRLWEAEFDGRDDYVRIPDQENLNTSGFAIDIRFNKDEPFDSGSFETILSKGDESEDNLRYRIGIEEKTEDSYNLIADFFTANQEHRLMAEDLSRNTWYGTTLVVESDSISLYLNGQLYSQISKAEDLKGNGHDLYMATGEEEGTLANFYEGRLDDFKYWKQKLSGQDILYLYYPAKEFEVYIDFFQSCCETGYYQGVEVSASHPMDTIIIDEASPTGYDSVYYLRHIPSGQGPQLIDSGFFNDIIETSAVSCNESCSQSVSWLEPRLDMFEDGCGVSSIVSSHTPPLELNAEMPYAEVVYSVRNNCGDEKNYSFSVELECEAEDYIEIPRDNNFVLQTNESCEEESDSIFCKGRTIRLQPIYYDSLGETISNDYSGIDSLKFSLSIRAEGSVLTLESRSTGGVNLPIHAAGSYEICFDRIESSCETMYPNVCRTIQIVDVFERDFGEVIACPGYVESLVPLSVSQDLRAEILSDPYEGMHEVYYESGCGCIYREALYLAYAAEREPARVHYDLCEGESIVILGEEFGTDEQYEDQEIQFEGASEGVSSNGLACDSVILLTIQVLENAETVINRQICEGASFEGYNSEGTYTDNFIGSNGCDSTRILNLEVLPELETELALNICEGESYDGYSASGEYEDVFVSEAGCDSTVYLSLNVLDHIYTEIEKSICPGESYMGYTEAGVYEEAQTALNGCDSIVVLFLELLDEEDPECQSSSVSEITEEVVVFPNPSFDVLNIKNTINVLGMISCRVYTTTGKMLINNNGRRDQLDIQRLAPGLYYLELVFINGQRTVAPFVKL